MGAKWQQKVSSIVGIDAIDFLMTILFLTTPRTFADAVDGDPDILQSRSNDFNQLATNYSNAVKKIRSSCADLDAHWSGSASDAYIRSMNEVVTHLEKLQTKSEKQRDEIQSLVDALTSAQTNMLPALKTYVHTAQGFAAGVVLTAAITGGGGAAMAAATARVALIEFESTCESIRNGLESAYASKQSTLTQIHKEELDATIKGLTQEETNKSSWRPQAPE